MPVLLLDVGESIDDEDIAGETVTYTLVAEMRTRFDDIEGLDQHRDLANAAGLAGALARIEEGGGLRCSTLISQEVKVDVETIDMDDGTSRAEYSYVRVDCDWYVQSVTAAVPADATPPTLDADLADIWGITIDGDIMYLAESTPETVAESDIHSYDLTTNMRRTQEITAGISQTQHHRGLDNDGTHIYLVDDDGTRGSWVLNKIGIATNSVDAIADLGAGAYSGCAIHGDNDEFVLVARREGSTTRYRIFNTSDLSESSTELPFNEVFGEVSGIISLGGYVFHVAGSTAIATDASGRRGDLDIDLNSFRVQWHDLARRLSLIHI